MEPKESSSHKKSKSTTRKLAEAIVGTFLVFGIMAAIFFFWMVYVFIFKMGRPLPPDYHEEYSIENETSSEIESSSLPLQINPPKPLQ